MEFRIERKAKDENKTIRDKIQWTAVHVREILKEIHEDLEKLKEIKQQIQVSR